MGLPSQAKYIVGNEACERFSFYGMRSILVVYLITQLNFGEAGAMTIFHLFLAAIYIMPLLGAWLADQFLGRYKTILSISLFYCVGHATLAITDLFPGQLLMQQIIFITGLSIIAMGSGGIKPCVSAFVGDQMKGRSPREMTAMYSAFYWSINLGSFFAILLIPTIKDTEGLGYPIAFAIPGVFMALATFIFWLGRRKYIHTEPAQPHFFKALLSPKNFEPHAPELKEMRRSKGHIIKFALITPLVLALGTAIYLGLSKLGNNMGMGSDGSYILALSGMVLYAAALLFTGLKLSAKAQSANFLGVLGKNELSARYSPTQRKEASALLRIFIVFAMVTSFWCLYDQTASSWLIQARQMTPYIFDFGFFTWSLNAETMQTINPLLVMLFIPLLTLFVYPYIGKFGTPLSRMSIGILLSGLSFVVVGYMQTLIDGGAQLSILWQCLPFAILTLAEVLVSATGLEYAYTSAGPKLKSTVTSFWNLTIALANIFVVVLTAMFADPASSGAFFIYAGMAIAIGLLFIAVTRRPSYQTTSSQE